MIPCKKCAKELTCKKEACNFKSWIQTRNYGEVKRQKKEKIQGNFDKIKPKNAKKSQILIK